MRSRAVCLLVLSLLVATPRLAVAQDQPAPVRLDSLSFPQPPLTPGGAFIRSLVVPGWAQAELGAPTRGAFYFLAEAFSLVMLARSQIRLSQTQRSDPSNEALLDAREQQREDWIALAVFTAFFSAADGFVSVHLWGFDERTGVSPEGEMAAEVTIRIPFGP
ncbi:MAG: hypothetical protein GWN99_04610 [Gemmatimonadetes bacterium]|uniref:DUF5683 domain-containing protein n=1 Tax=Candidatus Kutchimonas denitrificans TaxID=3056748 RepID=A0AAE4ZAN4_9BACT|nr:hypothetical protein [Gemmatimonadota bacterium]NIR75732.1 hypothetical protein [Candidatus Kutchimonas denitrificans]NIS00345.1 hypothetical protein [Gemmatimonadota bacterium]NIT66004.1 hypothetical protein [Gemmatimonadota bacterium]NIU53708.1 hypothetical protein [Gemmatimonadota bacterium]